MQGLPGAAPSVSNVAFLAIKPHFQGGLNPAGHNCPGINQGDFVSLETIERLAGSAQL